MPKFSGESRHETLLSMPQGNILASNLHYLIYYLLVYKLEIRTYRVERMTEIAESVILSKGSVCMACMRFI